MAGRGSGRPRADPAAVPAPLGAVQRFEEARSAAEYRDVVEQAQRVWVVHKTRLDGDGSLTDLVESIRDDGFRVERHDHLPGGVQLVLLERP